MTHPERAVELFDSGYNCAQSVFCAFSDVTGFDEKTSLRLASSLGAGIGGAREVCGAITAGAMVLGAVKGYDVPDDLALKRKHYARVTDFVEGFRADYETIICRELLNGLKVSNVPSERTPEYYRTRPCARFVHRAAELVDELLSKDEP